MKAFSRFLTLVGFVSLCAQAQNPATLTGTLSDPSGAGVARAEVTAERLPASSVSLLRTTSGNDGRFSFSLAPGRYRLRVTHASFSKVEQETSLAPGETRELALRLRLEPLAASVVVSAQAEPVTAEATSAPVTIITRAEIEQRQATSLPELLLSVPGFSLGRTGRGGGITSLFLNGGNSSFTKVLVDGTTVNEPGGAINFSNFTLDNVEKVEVVRGAESALYGSDAMTGVVQVFTHRGTTRRPRLTLLAEGGKFDTARGSGQLSGVVGRFDYSAAAAYFTTAGQGPNEAFLNRTLSGNFGWRFSDTNRLRVSLRNNTSDAGVAGQTLLVRPNVFQHNALKNFSANLRWDFQTGPRWHHKLAATESYIRQWFFLSPTFTTRNNFNRADFVGQSSYLFPRGAVSLGYHHDVENGSLRSESPFFPSSLHARRNNQAGYLDARIQLAPRLTVNAGVRAEDNSSFGTRVVPRVGAAYALRHGQGFWGATRLRFSFGLGIKEPTMVQSFSPNPGFRGNPGLRPERSRTIDVGADQRFASDRVRVSFDYFDSRFRDIISFASSTFFNTDLARARGTNVAVEARPVRWLNLGGNYSYVDSRVLKAPNTSDQAFIPGNRLLRRPVHSGNLTLNAAFRRMNWNFSGYFTGRRTDSTFLAPTVTRNPGYARFDLAGSYEVRRGMTLFGRIENLFDKQHQEALGFPALRRGYRAGMKFTLGGE